MDKCQNWRKIANLDLSDLEKLPLKMTFRAIQSNPSFDSSLVPFLGNDGVLGLFCAHCLG